jgi:hypothetical protein
MFVDHFLGLGMALLKLFAIYAYLRRQAYLLFKHTAAGLEVGQVDRPTM